MELDDKSEAEDIGSIKKVIELAALPDGTTSFDIILTI